MKIAITTKLIISILLIFCICALAAAYISEYLYGYKPCILCLYQRIPYFLIIIASILALLINKKHLIKSAIILSILALFANSAIAFYHVGVEQKVFKMTAKCSDNLAQSNSLEDLKLAINSKTSARCDQPELLFLGLSMAFWNLIASLTAAIIAITLFRKRVKS